MMMGWKREEDGNRGLYGYTTMAYFHILAGPGDTPGGVAASKESKHTNDHSIIIKTNRTLKVVLQRQKPNPMIYGSTTL